MVVSRALFDLLFALQLLTMNIHEVINEKILDDDDCLVRPPPLNYSDENMVPFVFTKRDLKKKKVPFV